MAWDEMTIGRLAGTAGVHVETIRYYQRLELLPTPVRRHRGQRRYGGEDLKRVRFIKRAQELGFSLAEIRMLLGFAKHAHCAETRLLAREKLAVVERKLAGLNAMRTALQELIRACESGQPSAGCPIIERLSGSEDAPEAT
jgi:MerR family mercuric resistance operon transcriptional regulator